MQLQISSSSLRLDSSFGPVLRCDERFPLLYVGQGEERVDMYRGNFQIEDHVIERRALSPVITRTETGAVLKFENALTITLTVDGERAVLTFQQHDPSINRLWLRIPAEKDECVWGCTGANKKEKQSRCRVCFSFIRRRVFQRTPCFLRSLPRHTAALRNTMSDALRMPDHSGTLVSSPVFGESELLPLGFVFGVTLLC